MKLDFLLENIVQLSKKRLAGTYQVLGDFEGRELKAITSDSREVSDGSLFIALKGAKVDGHNYIEQCINQGASVIVCEDLPARINPHVCYVKVENSYEFQAFLASAWYGNPSEEMKVIGVTGTNGKTTTATLLYRLFRSLGYEVGLISTVCNYIGSEEIPATHTTPMPLALQALLAQMRDHGCSHVFMEVSSHAVAQHRIDGIDYSVAVFTNLSRDHLDYHGTFADYLKAKKTFFDYLSPNAVAITNIDDKNGLVMLQNCQAKKQSYSLTQCSDFKVEILEQHADHTLLSIDGSEVVVRLVGHFNAYNLLAVYATAYSLGLDKQEILTALSQLRSVDGRLESFHSDKKGYTAFVDYAHTPDALANVLETLHALRNSSAHHEAKIICVVGCGGDRDKGKRPLMTKEAVRLADQVILTSDNPRTEVPEAIIQDMKEGIPVGAEAQVLSICDRAEAIRTACLLAGENDLILVAGKGHESYQEINGVKYDFDDREILRIQFAQEK